MTQDFSSPFAVLASIFSREGFSRSIRSSTVKSNFVCQRFIMGNGQKREYPVLFWPKTDVPQNDSGRECCWPYLVGQHPLSPVFGQKRPGTPGNATLLSFHPFLTILCSFPVGYSTTRIHQHGPQEQLTLKFA